MSELGAVTRARVERFWAGVFGTSTEASTPWVTVHTGDLTSYPGVLAVVRDDRVLVTAPPNLALALVESPPSPAEVVSPSWWADRLPGWRVLGPSVHAFTDRLPGVDHAGTEDATPEDPTQLRAAVPPEEWEESGFDHHVQGAWVVRDGSRAVAAAGLATFDGVPADVGVLTVPEVRGRGFAARVAARAVAEAVTAHGIARWRSLATNEPSRRLAVRLGFHDDAVQLAVLPGR